MLDWIPVVTGERHKDIQDRSPNTPTHIPRLRLMSHTRSPLGKQEVGLSALRRAEIHLSDTKRHGLNRVKALRNRCTIYTRLTSAPFE